MTKEQWNEECGFGEDECYLVGAIKKHLLTPAQKEFLHQFDMTIEDLLNGRWPVHMGEFLQTHFFDEWNKILGWKEFGV